MSTYGRANIAPRRVSVSPLHIQRHPTAWTLLKPSPPAREVARLPEYPEPEVGARDALSEEIPGGARTFMKKLAGIPHRVTFARGWLPGAHGEPTRLVDSIAVRVSPIPFKGVTLVCMWIDGRSAGCVMRTVNGPRKGNLDDAKRLLGFEVKARAAVVRKPRLTAIKGGKEGMR